MGSRQIGLAMAVDVFQFSWTNALCFYPFSVICQLLQCLEKKGGDIYLVASTLAFPTLVQQTPLAQLVAASVTLEGTTPTETSTRPLKSPPDVEEITSDPIQYFFCTLCGCLL